MPEWPKTTVGQHVKRRIEPVALAPDEEYSSLGIRYDGGVYVRNVKLGRELRTKMYRARAGDFIYCILDSQRGPFDLVPEEMNDAVVTNKFPTYEVGPDLVAEFLKLCFQRHATLEAIGMARQGAEGRSEWKPDQFEAHVIPFPDRTVQARMVEIVSAIDSVLAALQAEVDAAQAVRVALLDELLQRRDETWDEMPVGKLGPLTRGKRFVKADYVSEGIGCIHYSQIHTDFGAYTHEVSTHLPEEMRARLRFAAPGSLVIAGTSENIEGVLKAVAWLGEEPVAVHDDAYILNHSLEPRYAAYLFASPGFRAQVENVYSDTKVVRVSRDNLARLTVPVPPVEKQEEIADAIDALDRQISATDAEIKSARLARAAFLDAMLARTVEVMPAEPSTKDADPQAMQRA